MALHVAKTASNMAIAAAGHLIRDNVLANTKMSARTYGKLLKEPDDIHWDGVLGGRDLAKTPTLEEDASLPENHVETSNPAETAPNPQDETLMAKLPEVAAAVAVLKDLPWRSPRCRRLALSGRQAHAQFL
ncbi:Uncharacterized protein SCF082_LOCUS29116 [Durusdinium trenchii]